MKGISPDGKLHRVDHIDSPALFTLLIDRETLSSIRVQPVQTSSKIPPLKRETDEKRNVKMKDG